jgi:hypothetical protein
MGTSLADQHRLTSHTPLRTRALLAGGQGASSGLWEISACEVEEKVQEKELKEDLTNSLGTTAK